MLPDESRKQLDLKEKEKLYSNLSKILFKVEIKNLSFRK
jgi:hypothetical protein